MIEKKKHELAEDQYSPFSPTLAKLRTKLPPQPPYHTFSFASRAPIKIYIYIFFNLPLTPYTNFMRKGVKGRDGEACPFNI